MLTFIADRVLDLGLSVLDTEATRLDICSAAPSTFAAATASLSLGNRTGLAVGAPAARSPSGRRVTVAAFAGAAVTATGTATHWAITDTVNSRLLAAGTLDAAQAVTAGNTFELPAFDIGIPGVA